MVTKQEGGHFEVVTLYCLRMTEKILAVLANFIIAVISGSGYLGIALLMGIESACIPLPSEIIMPFSGYLVHTGRFQLLWVATAGALGCNLGSAVAFWGGSPRGPSAGGAFWQVRSPQSPRSGPHHAFLSQIRIDHRFPGASAAGGAHLHRPTCRNRSHATVAFPYLYLPGLLALVLGPGLRGHAAWQLM